MHSAEVGTVEASAGPLSLTPGKRSNCSKRLERKAKRLMDSGSFWKFCFRRLRQKRCDGVSADAKGRTSKTGAIDATNESNSATPLKVKASAGAGRDPRTRLKGS